MKTIIKSGMWKILKLFYENKNKKLHLREISRQIKLNESSVYLHLNSLVKDKIMNFEMEGNLKKFSINKNHISQIFPMYDDLKLENLPLLRKNAIKEYIRKNQKKPIFLVVFGSTAKENYKDDSDIDILEVYSAKTDNKDIIKDIEKLTNMKIHNFQMNEKEFNKELKYKEEPVIQAALETGFPVFNQKYYYEIIYNE